MRGYQVRVRQIVKRVSVALLLVTGLYIGSGITGEVAFAAPTASSQLTQDIVSDDCQATSYDTGLGQVNQPYCDVFAPVVNRYDATDGKLIFYGAFDAVHTQTNIALGVPYLQVEVNGIIYTLGISPELHVDGNAWWLDLSAIRSTFDDGVVYAIRVSSVMSDGRVLSGEGAFMVGTKGVPLAPDTGAPRNTLLLSIILMSVGLVSMLVSFGYVYLVKRQKNKEEHA